MPGTVRKLPQDRKKKTTVAERQEREAEQARHQATANWLNGEDSSVTFTFQGEEYEVETMDGWTVGAVRAFENRNIASFVGLLYGDASPEWQRLSRVRMRDLDGWFVALEDAIGVQAGEADGSES